MLSRLSIRDIVLIEKLDIDFQPGLSVLTGETGAGKSILLDALSLALGARGDASLVRHGAAHASSCFTSLTALCSLTRVSVWISCFEAALPASGVAVLVPLSVVAAKATAGTAAAEAASAGTRTFLTEDLLVGCGALSSPRGAHRGEPLPAPSGGWFERARRRGRALFEALRT